MVRPLGYVRPDRPSVRRAAVARGTLVCPDYSCRLLISACDVAVGTLGPIPNERGRQKIALDSTPGCLSRLGSLSDGPQDPLFDLDPIAYALVGFLDENDNVIGAGGVFQCAGQSDHIRVRVNRRYETNDLRNGNLHSKW